jgi:phosphoribosyl 1,2-cyclic phosphodiesterase
MYLILQRAFQLKALILLLLQVKINFIYDSIVSRDLYFLKVHHGIFMSTKEPYICFGFKFGDVSYISDTNFIPPETMKLIEGKSRIFVLDCLRCKL